MQCISCVFERFCECCVRVCIHLVLYLYIVCFESEFFSFLMIFCIVLFYLFCIIFFTSIQWRNDPAIVNEIKKNRENLNNIWKATSYFSINFSFMGLCVIYVYKSVITISFDTEIEDNFIKNQFMLFVL